MLKRPPTEGRSAPVRQGHLALRRRGKPSIRSAITSIRVGGWETSAACPSADRGAEGGGLVLLANPGSGKVFVDGRSSACGAPPSREVCRLSRRHRRGG